MSSRPLTTVDSMGFVVTIHFSPDGSLVGYTWYDGVRGGDDLRRVMLDGSQASRESFLAAHARGDLNAAQRTQL